MRRAQARIDQASGRKAIASYLVPSNPRINLEIRTDRTFQNQREGESRIAIEQELEIFGQRGLRIAMTDAELAGVRLELVAARARVRADVAITYFDLQYQERRVAVLAAVVEQAARIEEAVRRRAAAGDLGEAEHTLIAADLATARADARAAEAEQRAASARLAVLAGRSVGDTLTTTGEMPALPPAPSLESVLTLAHQRRPDLQSATSAITASEREIALRKRERLPNPTLSFGYSRDRAVFTGDDVRPGGVVSGISDADQFLMFGVSFPLPLFRTGRGEIAEARGRRSEVEAERDGLRAAIDSDVAAAHARYEEARVRATELAGVESTLAATLTLYESAYTAGKLDLSAYLAIRDRVLRAQLAAIIARHDAAVASAQLALAAGDLPGAL